MGSGIVELPGGQHRTLPAAGAVSWGNSAGTARLAPDLTLYHAPQSPSKGRAIFCCANSLVACAVQGIYPPPAALHARGLACSCLGYWQSLLPKGRFAPALEVKAAPNPCLWLCFLECCVNETWQQARNWHLASPAGARWFMGSTVGPGRGDSTSRGSGQ